MPDHQGPILTVDQENACERLLALAHVRAMTTLETLPPGVLSHWSVPLLVGPSASGKAFVCAEAARRWEEKPCRRWEVSGWTLASNRTNQGTFEQLQAYVADNPGGCIVYLAGIDTLAAASEHHASYFLAVAGEIAHFLTQATARPASFLGRDGNVIPARALVVVGGCFAALWGEASIGGPDHREAWRHADADPLADGHAVAQWLWNDSSLPAGILRRLAPEPLVLRSLDRAEADRLAERLRDRLPSSLDGLGADEFSRALQSSSGWRAVAALVEQAWVAGHEPLILAEADEPSLPSPANRGAVHRTGTGRIGCAGATRTRTWFTACPAGPAARASRQPVAFDRQGAAAWIANGLARRMAGCRARLPVVRRRHGPSGCCRSSWSQ